MRPYDKKLMDRTCRIIERGGFIILKRGAWYLHQHTSIEADWDSVVWGTREAAMHIDSLELALLLAPYFECKVISYYPKGKGKKR